MNFNVPLKAKLDQENAAENKAWLALAKVARQLDLPVAVRDRVAAQCLASSPAWQRIKQLDPVSS